MKRHCFFKDPWLVYQALGSWSSDCQSMRSLAILGSVSTDSAFLHRSCNLGRVPDRRQVIHASCFSGTNDAVCWKVSEIRIFAASYQLSIPLAA